MPAGTQPGGLQEPRPQREEEARGGATCSLPEEEGAFLPQEPG